MQVIVACIGVLSLVLLVYLTWVLLKGDES